MKRTKLLRAHYAGALPLELLKSEQDRISRQLAAVEDRLQRSTVRVTDLDAALTAPLDLFEHCHATYLQASKQASNQQRRLLNLGCLPASGCTGTTSRPNWRTR